MKDAFDDGLQKTKAALALTSTALGPKPSENDGRAWVVDAQTGETREYDPARDGDALVFQNGMMNSEEAALANGMALSRKTGKPVVVVYNSSEGFVPDVTQSALDKVDPFGLVHRNPATDTQAELMYSAASEGRPVTVVAHSQGALITRDALIRTHARLYAEKYAETLGRTHDPVRAHLEAKRFADERIQNVHVVTAGGAALVWPPYARVDHVTNAADPVPGAFGQNALLDPVEVAKDAGAPVPLPDRRDVDVIYQPTDPRAGGLPGHSFGAVYLDDVAQKL